MKKFSLNYKEGMFLGKQELERQNLISQSMNFTLQRLFQISTPSLYTQPPCGLFDLYKLGVQAYTFNDGIGFYVSARYTSVEDECLGRLVVGRDTEGKYIGLPLGDYTNYLKKEAFLSSTVYSGITGTRYIYFKPEETNYENAILNINANGTGEILTQAAGYTQGLADLFRQGTQGRYTKIKTEGNQVLTVQSISGNTITFMESAVTAEMNTRFMFVHTLSPLVNETVEPLYAYPSCSIYLSTTINDTDSGKRFLAGDVVFEDGTPTQVQIRDVATANYRWVDFVGYRRVEERHLANDSVTEDKIADDAVTEYKITDGAVTTDKIADENVTRSKLHSGAFGYRYIDDDETSTILPGRLRIYTSGVGDIPFYFGNDLTETEALLQPAKIILYPRTDSQQVQINGGVIYPDSSVTIRFNSEASSYWDNTHFVVLDIYWAAWEDGNHKIFVKVQRLATT